MLSWAHLNLVSKVSRYLGYVDPKEFEDHHSPAPHLYVNHDHEVPEPGWEEDLDSSLDVQSFNPDLIINRINSWEIPGMIVTGYEYDVADQPYHLEVWVEKSTMNSVLDPVCRDHGANLIPHQGNPTMMAAVEALERITARGKPTRIFYIADFDPSGEDMPATAARHLDYWSSRYAPGINIKLTPIALTREQVIEHQLLRIPVKDSDLRKAGFEKMHGGGGAVELDALPAGVLEDLVGAVLGNYYDGGLQIALDEQGTKAEIEVNDAWQQEIEDQRAEMDAIRGDARTLVEGYRPMLEELEREMALIRKRRDDLLLVVESLREEFTVPLPERHEGGIIVENDSEFLFDTARDYWTQLDVYKGR
jgi:hypothetical protein